LSVKILIMNNNKKTDTIRVDKDSFRFNVDIYIFKERENYISYCPSLDICSSGVDFNDALKNFYEAFELYADYWVENGTLEEDLVAHGWKVVAHTAKPPCPQTLLDRPMFNELLSGDTGFERVVSPVRIAAR